MIQNRGVVRYRPFGHADSLVIRSLKTSSESLENPTGYSRPRARRKCRTPAIFLLFELTCLADCARVALGVECSNSQLQSE